MAAYLWQKHTPMRWSQATQLISLCVRADVLLRRYSRIAGYDIAVPMLPVPMLLARQQRVKENEVEGSETQETGIASPPLAYLTGTLYELVAQGRPNETRIVGLAELLEIPVSTTIAEFTQLYEQQQKVMRDGDVRGALEEAGGSSSRRQLMASIVEKWPELEDSKQWGDSTLLRRRQPIRFCRGAATVARVCRVCKRTGRSRSGTRARDKRGIAKCQIPSHVAAA